HLSPSAGPRPSGRREDDRGRRAERSRTVAGGASMGGLAAGDRGDLSRALRPLGGRPSLSAPGLGAGARLLPPRHASDPGRGLPPEHSLAGSIPGALALPATPAGLAAGGRRSA